MPKLPAVHYRVEPADLHAHLYRITLTLKHPAPQQRVSLPVWTPGSYLVREFSKHLQNLQAKQSRKQLAIKALDKCTWQIDCTSDAPLVLSYEVYAHDPSVRAAFLDAHRGFFNNTSMCLRVHGSELNPHKLELVASNEVLSAQPAWGVATALKPHKVDAKGFGTYQAEHYDELVDAPFELGAFWSGEFEAGGRLHKLVVSGALPAWDSKRLLQDVKKICETEIAFWRTHPGEEPPFEHYVFMLHALDDGYGGLEHRNSTALICSRKDLPRTSSKLPEGYNTLLGLFSHEYFHTWNVKRLRPAEFAQYDYAQENYTELLWLFEGFTSYYDDLLLRRAQLLDDAAYLKLLNKTINHVLQTPGRLVQTVAEASRDAWIKYYRQDENTPNATVSYYTKGALVALCLDLKLRAEGATTLDEVMRHLWQHSQGGPISQADLLLALRTLSGRDWQKELNYWVHSTQELPLQELLKLHGVAVHEDPAQLAQRLGLRVQEDHGLRIKAVLRGGAAEAAGFAAGDEWLGMELPDAQRSAWRVHKLDDVWLYAGSYTHMVALVSRDQRLLRLKLAMPKHSTTWRLAIEDAAKVSSWLG